VVISTGLAVLDKSGSVKRDALMKGKQLFMFAEQKNMQ